MTTPATTAILNANQVITASGASTDGGGAGAFTLSALSDATVIGIDVTAVSGTNPSCAFYMDESPDGGTTWVPVGLGTPLMTVAAIGTWVFHIGAMRPTGRLRWVVSGTTPSFTVNAVKFP